MLKYDFIIILFMSLIVVQRLLLSKQLTAYFNKCNLFFDCSKVLQNLSLGLTIPEILKNQQSHLIKKDHTSLKKALQAEELVQILHTEMNKIKIIQSSRFKDLQRLFFSLPQNVQLLNFSIKIFLNLDYKSEQLQYQSTISSDQKIALQKILGSDEFIMWQKSSSRLDISKNQNDILPITQIKEIDSAFIQAKSQLEQLLGFNRGYSERIIDVIINGKQISEQLVKIEDQLTITSFQALSKAINSRDFLKIRQKIKQQKYKEFIENISSQIGVLLKQFKFDPKIVIDSIMSQQSQQQFVNKLQDKITVTQSKRLLELLSSQRFKQIRAHLNKKTRQELQRDSFLLKKEKQLTQMMNNLKGTSPGLVKSIVNQQIQIQKNILLKLSEKISAKQYRLLKQFMQSKKMIDFRNSLLLNKKQEDQDQNKIALQQIFKEIEGNQKIINVILDDKEIPFNELQQSMTFSSFKAINKILQSQELTKIKRKIKIKNFNKKKQETKQILHKFSETKIPELITTIINGQQFDAIIQDLKLEMKGQDYRSLLDILKQQNMSSLIRFFQTQSAILTLEINLEQSQQKVVRLFKKQNIKGCQDIINKILQGELYCEILIKVQSSYSSQYSKIKQILDSQQTVTTNKIIYQIKKTEKKNKQISELKLLMQPFKINAKAFQSIINLQSYKQANNLYMVSAGIQEKYYKQFAQLLESQKFINLKKCLKQINIEMEKRQELEGLFKNFKSNTIGLIQAIITAKNQQKMMQILHDQMKGREFKNLEQLMKSQKIYQIKKQLAKGSFAAKQNIREISLEEQLDSFKIIQNQNQIDIQSQRQKAKKIYSQEFILKSFNQERGQDKKQLDQLFNQIQDVQDIINMVLSGRQDAILLQFIEKTKKERSFRFKKIIKKVLEKNAFKNLRAKLIKMEKISNIFCLEKDLQIVNFLNSANSFTLSKCLQPLRFQMGLNRFEQISYKLYSKELQYLTGYKFIPNEQTRKLLEYFYSKKILASCLQFFKQILNTDQHNKKVTLEKYKSKFTNVTYNKMEIEIDKKQFILQLYKLKHKNFDDIFQQALKYFQFLAQKQLLVQAIIVEKQFQRSLEEILRKEQFQSLSYLYPTLENQTLNRILSKIHVKIPKYQEKFVVVKERERYIFPKGVKISNIKTEKDFNFTNEVFMNRDSIILQNDDRLIEHIFCFKGEQYFVDFLDSDFSILLPANQLVRKSQNILKNKLNIKNEVCIQVQKNNQLVVLKSQSLLKNCGSNNLYLSYYLNLIFKIGLNQLEQVKVRSSDTILSIKKMMEAQISIKQSNQKWRIDKVEITHQNDQTFADLKIVEEFVRVEILEQKSLQFYGFDEIIPIERDQFKSFYIQDDDYTKKLISKADFNSQTWKNHFRKICLGYIFSGLKKQSKIESILKHLQNLVLQSGKQQQIWKPKTIQQKRYFNSTYVIFNIIKSCSLNIRTDILKCLMNQYPIPLLMKNDEQKQVQLYEENYWITNKAFTIISFGLSKQSRLKQPINGKSSLLNIIFKTNFQNKQNLHRQCKGGINIEYNIYQNDQFYINLVDVSSNVSQNIIDSMLDSCNLIIIHTNQQGQFVQQWIKSKKITVPIIIFLRDVKQSFNSKFKLQRKIQKQSNQKNMKIKKFTLPEIKSNYLQFFDTQIKEITSYVQNFIRESFQSEEDQNLWKFSNYLSEKCCNDYDQFNKTLMKLHQEQQQLSNITNYFYQWRKLIQLRNIENQNQTNQKIAKIKTQGQKKGISENIKHILMFYQNNIEKAALIMRKLRMHLSFTRNNLFKYFNNLYNTLETLYSSKKSSFQENKKQICQILRNIEKMTSKLITQKVRKLIQEFKKNQSLYKCFEDVDEKWKKIFKDITMEFEEKIQPKAFSIETFWREIIYMENFSESYTFLSNDQEVNLQQSVVSLGKRHIIDSQHFEIINGDLLQMPYNFLKKVFQKQEKKKIMIVGIIGPQSSGKSTLLNFIFGCDFMSSAGRCTKGIYGTYFQISNKQIPNCQAILVLDTEGLFSNHKEDNFGNRNSFDNKLVLFCLQVCDLIIMNTRGDMTSQCQQILANAFDSQINDSKNLPTVYFVLNCNNGPSNTNQKKQIEKTCSQIIKLNPAASSVVRPNNSKGMSMAFQEFTQQNDLKYWLPKKIPSQAFYKETSKLSCEFFKILSDRGECKLGRTLNQVFDDMAQIWETIKRFSILTINNNRQMKKTQQKVQKWIKQKSEDLQKISSVLKKQINMINFKQIQKWEKVETDKLKDGIKRHIEDFHTTFPIKEVDSANYKNKSLLRQAQDNIRALFQSILQDFKGFIAEKKYTLEINESQQNGLDDINSLVKQIKKQQLQKNVQLSDMQKQKRFDKLWMQRITKMNTQLNQNNFGVESYRRMAQSYNSSLKAFHLTKNIQLLKPKDTQILFYQYKEFSDLDDDLIIQIQNKYEDLPIFQSSKQKPVINVEKKLGDLSFKYLDMSEYFQKKINKFYISFKSQQIIKSLFLSSVRQIIKLWIKQSNIEGKNVIAEYLQHDIKHLMGIQLKLQRLKQWIDQALVRQLYEHKYLKSSSPIIFDIDEDAIDFHKRSNKRPNEKKYPQLIIERNKWYFSFKCNRPEKQIAEYKSKFKIIKDFKKLQQIIFKQKCRNTIDGNNQIINKIFNSVEQIVAKQINQIDLLSNLKLKQKIDKQIPPKLMKDLQKLNISIKDPTDLLDKLFNGSKIAIQSNGYQVQYSSQSQINDIILRLPSYWNRQILLNSYIKKKEKGGSLVTIGFINEIQLNVKEKYIQEKILQAYIGKQYQQLLDEVQTTNFKEFIKKQLKHYICYQQIYNATIQISQSNTDLNAKLLTLRNKINQILRLINKDLQQVSQILKIDFMFDLHTYGFNLLWHLIVTEQLRKKKIIIEQFQNKRNQQYQRFLLLSSGLPEKQNIAASALFASEYLKFLNNKIQNQKMQKIISVSQFFNHKYSRKRIQEQIQQILQEQLDQNRLLDYLLKPEEQIQKIIQAKIKNPYTNQLQKYTIIDYDKAARQLFAIVSQFYEKNCLNEKICSIEDVFEFEMMDKNKNKAFIKLFCEVILKTNRDYVSSQSKLGQLVIKAGQKYKINKCCHYDENTRFLNQVRVKDIVITNISLFCKFLRVQLAKIINGKLIKQQVSAQDKLKALKSLKIEICKQKCPLCKSLCHVDMLVSPHHAIHQCNFGHQIRIIGGMVVQQFVSDKITYKASILRCDDLNPNSKFQFNGRIYKWSQFKKQYQSQWNFQIVCNQSIKNKKQFDKILWEKVGRKICNYYSKADKKVQYVQLSQSSIRNQLNGMNVKLKSAHYIFAIDQSSSMAGEKWTKAVDNLRQTIQLISNYNQGKNQWISLFKFNDQVQVVFDTVLPVYYDQHALTMKGGNTSFGPVFRTAIQLMKKYHENRNNTFIMISDGLAYYPEQQIKEMAQFIKNQKAKGFVVNFTLLFISEIENEQSNVITEKIIKELNGRYKQIPDPSQIASFLRQVHFNQLK